MTELTIEERLGRLEKYAQTQCSRCEKIITLNETHFLPHFSDLYNDEHKHDEMALCADCYICYQTLKGVLKKDTEVALRDYIIKIRCKKYGGQ